MGHDGTANESCKFRGSELMIWVQGTCVIHPKDKGQYCRSVYTAQTKIEEQIARMQAYAHERMYFRQMIGITCPLMDACQRARTSVSFMLGWERDSAHVFRPRLEYVGGLFAVCDADKFVLQFADGTTATPPMFFDLG